MVSGVGGGCTLNGLSPIFPSFGVIKMSFTDPSLWQFLQLSGYNTSQGAEEMGLKQAAKGKGDGELWK